MDSNKCWLANEGELLRAVKSKKTTPFHDLELLDLLVDANGNTLLEHAREREFHRVLCWLAGHAETAIDEVEVPFRVVMREKAKRALYSHTLSLKCMIKDPNWFTWPSTWPVDDTTLLKD